MGVERKSARFWKSLGGIFVEFFVFCVSKKGLVAKSIRWRGVDSFGQDRI